MAYDRTTKRVTASEFRPSESTASTTPHVDHTLPSSLGKNPGVESAPPNRQWCRTRSRPGRGIPAPPASSWVRGRTGSGNGTTAREDTVDRRSWARGATGGAGAPREENCGKHKMRWVRGGASETGTAETTSSFGNPVGGGSEFVFDSVGKGNEGLLDSSYRTSTESETSYPLKNTVISAEKLPGEETEGPKLKFSGGGCGVSLGGGNKIWKREDPSPALSGDRESVLIRESSSSFGMTEGNESNVETAPSGPNSFGVGHNMLKRTYPSSTPSADRETTFRRDASSSFGTAIKGNDSNVEILPPGPKTTSWRNPNAKKHPLKRGRPQRQQPVVKRIRLNPVSTSTLPNDNPPSADPSSNSHSNPSPNPQSSTRQPTLTAFPYREITRPSSSRPRAATALIRVNPKSSTPICPTILRGTVCSDETCTKRHDIKREAATPLCSFFQRNGMCLRSDCPFKHVKVNGSVGVCPDFRKLGFCEREGCKLRHVRK